MKRTHSITPDDPPRKYALPCPEPCSTSTTNSNPRSAPHVLAQCSLGSPTRQLEAAFATPESATLPDTPLTGRSRTRPRTARPSRHDSLMDTKVLLATRLKRTDSLNQPDLFRFAEHFEFLSLLGLTPHSEVYKVRHRQTGELFAVKRCRRKIQSRAERQRCMQEIMAVAALPEHPNIVGHYRAWQQEGHFYIQMDLCEGGNLGSISSAAQQHGQCLQEEVLWLVMRDVARGLQVLHNSEILHLDIKPTNIYAHYQHDGSITWRIGDFGLAVLKQQWDWEEGDGRYVAPELLNSHTSPSPAADVYSLGATLYECATGHVLPRSEAARDTGSVLLPNRSSTFQWLVQQMLLPNPTLRPTAASILEQIDHLHGWVRPFTPPSTSVATSPTSNATTALPSPLMSPRAGVGQTYEAGRGGVLGHAVHPGYGHGGGVSAAAHGGVGGVGGINNADMDVSFDFGPLTTHDDDTATGQGHGQRHGQQRGEPSQHMVMMSLPSFGDAVAHQRLVLDHEDKGAHPDDAAHGAPGALPNATALPHTTHGGSPCGSEFALQPMVMSDTPQLFRQASRRGGVPLRGPSFSFAHHPLPVGGEGPVHALGGLLCGMSDMSIVEDMDRAPGSLADMDRAPGSPAHPMTLRFGGDSGHSSPVVGEYGEDGDLAPQGPQQPWGPPHEGPCDQGASDGSAEDDDDVAGVLQSARKLSFGGSMDQE